VAWREGSQLALEAAGESSKATSKVAGIIFLGIGGSYQSSVALSSLSYLYRCAVGVPKGFELAQLHKRNRSTALASWTGYSAHETSIDYSHMGYLVVKAGPNCVVDALVARSEVFKMTISNLSR
jgi:hypothetical protein